MGRPCVSTQPRHASSGASPPGLARRQVLVEGGRPTSTPSNRRNDTPNSNEAPLAVGSTAGSSKQRTSAHVSNKVVSRRRATQSDS